MIKKKKPLTDKSNFFLGFERLKNIYKRINTTTVKSQVLLIRGTYYEINFLIFFQDDNSSKNRRTNKFDFTQVDMFLFVYW